MPSDFRSPFRRVLAFDPRTGILLLLIFGVARVALVLQANVTGNYQVVGAVFAVMIALPWILLTRDGRRRIGLRLPRGHRWWWLVPAFGAGAASALLVYLTAAAFWGHSTEHPFGYIALSYSTVPTGLSEAQRLMFFAIFAAIGVTFSPIGEEVLYRGFAHEGFASSLGDRRASLVDAGAFALVHLAHFGVVYVTGAWAFLPVPALLWVSAMFGVSLLFTAARAATGSLTGAIVAHAGFNLVMNAVIFFWILP